MSLILVLAVTTQINYYYLLVVEDAHPFDYCYNQACELSLFTLQWSHPIYVRCPLFVKGQLRRILLAFLNKANMLSNCILKI